MRSVVDTNGYQIMIKVKVDYLRVSIAVRPAKRHDTQHRMIYIGLRVYFSAPRSQTYSMKHYHLVACRKIMRFY